MDCRSRRSIFSAMKRILIAGLTGFLALAGVAGAAHADRSAPELTLEYEAYFGGFHVASARTAIERGDGRYEISGKARARGLLEWYSGWRGRTVSRGRLDTAGDVRPLYHEGKGEWGGGMRRNSLTFNPDGTVAVEREETEEREEEEATPIPPDSIPGAVDPISAILSLAAVMESGGSCDGAIPIYDGRRRYDIAVEQDGSKAFEPTEYSIFAGEAVACRVSLRRIGGFSTKPGRFRDRVGDRIVWVAQPLEEAPPVPVRVDIQTELGDLVIHLTAARFRGREIALTPGQDNLAD